MAWAQYSSLFVSSTGRGTGTVPRSCIESAEYIIQSIYATKRLPWSKAGEAREPSVNAHFGGGKSIDISKTPDFHKSALGLKDYPFTALPGIGQGLICLNNTKDDLGYNMHLGGVVATDTGKVLISNMMEPFGVSVTLVTLTTIEITNVADFRTDNFGSDAGKYALGLLST